MFLSGSRKAQRQTKIGEWHLSNLAIEGTRQDQHFFRGTFIGNIFDLL
jgi:hypothetical protein